MVKNITPTILHVLQILQKYSDEKHPLLQSELLTLLQQEFQLSITRKTLRAHLGCLEASGYPIYYQKGWYYEHEVCDSEISLLIHSLLFNRYIPYAQTKQLMKKLSSLGGMHSIHSFNFKEKPMGNAQFYYTLECINDAMDAQRQITFHYCQYDINKQLQPICDEEGQPKLYTVNPYDIAVVHGRHYLIGNVDKYDDISHFRLDRIKNIAVIENIRKAKENVHGFNEIQNITRYVERRPYMFSGSTKKYTLRIKHYLIGDVMDYFGKEVLFEWENETWVLATLIAEERSLLFWMRQYGEDVEMK